MNAHTKHIRIRRWAGMTATMAALLALVGIHYSEVTLLTSSFLSLASACIAVAGAAVDGIAGNAFRKISACTRVTKSNINSKYNFPTDDQNTAYWGSSDDYKGARDCAFSFAKNFTMSSCYCVQSGGKSCSKIELSSYAKNTYKLDCGAIIKVVPPIYIVSSTLCCIIFVVGMCYFMMSLCESCCRLDWPDKKEEEGGDDESEGDDEESAHENAHEIVEDPNPGLPKDRFGNVASSIRDYRIKRGQPQGRANEKKEDRDDIHDLDRYEDRYGDGDGYNNGLVREDYHNHNQGGAAAVEEREGEVVLGSPPPVYDSTGRNLFNGGNDYNYNPNSLPQPPSPAPVAGSIQWSPKKGV